MGSEGYHKPTPPIPYLLCIVFTTQNQSEILSNAMKIHNPVTQIIPTQTLSYQLAVLRGADPDKPRNLAKSVTVK